MVETMVVQYKGVDDELDRKIRRLVREYRLKYDGSGYNLIEDRRDHFIYGSDKANIAKFKSAVVKLARKVKIGRSASLGEEPKPKARIASVKRQPKRVVPKKTVAKKKQPTRSRLTRGRRSDWGQFMT